MNRFQWDAFQEYRNEYKQLCTKWMNYSAELKKLQIQACEKDTPPYPLENEIVYNTMYDSVTEDDNISLIVVGDNPGKEEQLNKNRKYLVGQSGRIAEGFFKRNSDFNIDFRKNVIITNKTPVHTAKTIHLKYLMKNGSLEVKELIEVSQIEMAKLTSEFHKNLNLNSSNEQLLVQLWLVGYSELKEKGIFKLYRNILSDSYKKNGLFTNDWNNVYVYQHFSMNRFLVDLKQYKTLHPDVSVVEAVKQIGSIHKNEIFGIN